jgi:ankyrin repeat protein
MCHPRTFTNLATASKPGDPAISRLQAFQTLAAPVYPIESMYSPGNHFNWVPKHDTYTKWLGSYGPSILHVHGASRISQVSDYIFQSLDDYATGTTKREIVINFKFDRDNDQCNSIVAMLTTFLARVFAHSEVMRDYVALVFEQMSFYSSWTQSELFIMFRQVLGHNSHGGFLFVIDGLDQCDDSRTPFLEELCNFLHNTEHHIKIVVTSTTDSTIQATLADWPTINLDDHPEIPEMTRNHLVSDVDLEVLELTQERPLFYGFEKLIAEKLLKCGHDSQWRRLVLNELRLSHTSITTSATRQKLESSSPTTPKDTFAQILERVSSERQPWARKALVWILYAFRPLKTWELGVALALEFDDLSNPEAELDKFGHQYVVANIDEIFGGMFVIKHHEIRPGHPEVRDFFTAMHGANVWYDVTEKAHQEITEACCSYLVLPQVQDSIATNHDDQPPIVGHSAGDTKYLVNTHSPSINNSHQYSFSSYAARYWPRHYKLIPQIFQATQPITRFLEDTNAFRRWSEADWWLSNPISRRDRGFLSSSLLPIFAGLGLKDLMKVSEAVGTYERALALTEAARNGYIEVIRMLLPYGGYDQSHIQQALVAGASCGNEMLLEELVTYAAKTIENFEWPPALLCRAATFSYESLAAKLIKFGASTNSPSIQGMTPLHFAVRQKQIGVVKLLLDNKAELSLTTTNVTSPLHIASIYGNPAAVKLLLDAGADVDSKDEYSLTAVYLACWHHRYRAVEVLVEAGADLSNDTKGEWTPLTAAGRMEILKCAQILLEHKANVDVEGFRNWTPLRYATAQGNLELSKLFLKYGADPNTPSGTLTSGTEPILGEPVRQGNLAMVTILVEKGAKVNAVSSEQWTPLLNASSAGKDDVVAYLLDHGADIDHANSTGHTAVILAAYSSFPKIVELLIEKGADIHRATSNGWTALHFAYDDMETTRVLMKYGADPNRIADFYTPLFLAAASNYTEAVKVLISFQADLEIEYANPTLHTGYTALCVATASEHIETVRVLLEAGANVNHQTTNNYFSLQFPVIDNNLELLRTLMEYNPDLNLVDDDGDTALHCISKISK